jgi:heme/copper-type cytochrome/quinol oxidase subunit 3
LPNDTGLPIVMVGTKSLGWLGMVFLLMVLSWVFATLFYAYFYLRLYSGEWPQDGLSIPNWPLSAIGFGTLLLAGALAFAAWQAFRSDRRWSFRLALAGSFGLAIAFFAFHAWELVGLPFEPQTNAYASIFYIISWTLDVVVFIGAMLAGTAFVRSFLVEKDWPFFLGQHAQLTSLFWGFTAVIAGIVYGVLYLSPIVL